MVQAPTAVVTRLLLLPGMGLARFTQFYRRQHAVAMRQPLAAAGEWTALGWAILLLSLLMPSVRGAALFAPVLFVAGLTCCAVAVRAVVRGVRHEPTRRLLYLPLFLLAVLPLLLVVMLTCLAPSFPVLRH
jgi:hypothetical protein